MCAVICFLLLAIAICGFALAVVACGLSPCFMRTQFVVLAGAERIAALHLGLHQSARQQLQSVLHKLTLRPHCALALCN